MNIESLLPYVEACPYPDGLQGITPEILGHGFFPAARGYKDVSPVRGIMLLGQDWGTMAQFNQWCGKPGQNETASTSRKVREICLPKTFAELPTR